MELFANIGISSYLCSVRNDYPGKFPERASRIRHYPILKQAASLGCGFAIFEKIRKKQSLAERERHSEGEDVGLRKKASLAKGRKKPANREKGTGKQGERYA